MTVRMENSNTGTSRYSISSDRGHTSPGPYRLPTFGQVGVMARTDYLVNGPSDCHLFLTASKPDGKEGRPFTARTTDGGLSWRFLGFIGPEPAGYAIMPATARVSATGLVTTIRRKDPPRSWIDAYASHDDGRTWSLLSTPEPDTGEGNPPSLLRLPDGRLALIYGVRARPYGIRARLAQTGAPPGARRSSCATTAAAPTSATSARSYAPAARSSPSTTSPTAPAPTAISVPRSGTPRRPDQSRRPSALLSSPSLSCRRRDAVLDAPRRAASEAVPRDGSGRGIQWVRL